MVEIISIVKILAEPQIFSQSGQLAVGGRVIAVRESKKLLFAEVSDGSTLRTLQLIFPRELLPHLTLGSVVKGRGQLVLVPERPHQLELRVQTIEWLSLAPSHPAWLANHRCKWLRIEKKR